jgi:hypothetical protein
LIAEDDAAFRATLAEQLTCNGSFFPIEAAAKVPAVAVLTCVPAKQDEEANETERALVALGLPLLETWMGERKVYRRALTQGQADPARRSSPDGYPAGVGRLGERPLH